MVYKYPFLFKNFLLIIFSVSNVSVLFTERGITQSHEAAAECTQTFQATLETIVLKRQWQELPLSLSVLIAYRIFSTELPSAFQF